MSCGRAVTLVAVGAVAVGAAGAAALYFYDRSQDDVIARGVTVGGVDVGLLTARQAETRLRERLLPALHRPVVVRHGTRRLALATAVRVDVPALVEEALERSRGGGFATRVLRQLARGHIDFEVPLRARVSRAAVERFADRVERHVSHAPRQGLVFPLPRALWVVPGVHGVQVRRDELAREVERTLADPSAPRLLTAPVWRSAPPLPRAELDAAVRVLERRVGHPARNARVVPTPAALTVAAGRDGVEVDGEALAEDALRALGRRRPALVEPPTRVVHPQIHVRDLARVYPEYLTVSRSERRLRLYQRLHLVKTYTVAIGAAGYETPTGLYRIVNKAVNPAWSVPRSAWAGSLAGQVIPGGVPQNPLKARWMGFYNGAGIHGTDALYSLGSAASHGCVRMSIPDVIDLYDRVPVRTQIYVG